MNIQLPIKYSEEVTLALNSNKPIVALESTIITHGMPYPNNLETAISVESIIRNNSCIPATIAIIEGTVCVGLTNSQLQYLAKLPKQDVYKCTRHNLSYIIATNKTASTTVCATMIIANYSNIKVFVTGGVGGVHRNAEVTMDISADLHELSNTKVAVVCGGIKSILDINKTLEYLETMGVPVITYGSEQFPSFFTRNSGIKSPLVSNDILEIAKVIKTNFQVSVTGLLIAVPVPDEADSIAVENAIKLALNEANDKNIKGGEVTPYILKRVNEITGGESLAANISLIKNNALVGAQIANQLNTLTN